jgi:hypothetical protein
MDGSTYHLDKPVFMVDKTIFPVDNKPIMVNK